MSIIPGAYTAGFHLATPSALRTQSAIRMIRLVQFQDKQGTVAGLVRDPETVWPIREFSVYALVWKAIVDRESLAEVAEAAPKGDPVSYTDLMNREALVAPITRPDPAQCIVSGTGLTHLGSASSRDSMHQPSQATVAETDSMRMFRWGLEGGKPVDGAIGIQPEWFFKGNGDVLINPGGSIPVPAFSQDIGEEPELLGVYVIGPDSMPWRIGFALGNEVSDHVMERANYLWLAHSKLRYCAFGPELVIPAANELRLFSDIQGLSRIRRGNRVLWEKPFQTGEAHMSHSLANLEHHHFKYRQFRTPGLLHLHFFGTSTLSFADGIRVQDGDAFEIEAPLFGPPLRNPVHFEKEHELVTVRVLAGE
jgi:hypothetical protein